MTHCGHCANDTQEILLHVAFPHYWLWLAFTTELNPFEHPRYRVLERALVSAGLREAQMPRAKKKKRQR